MASGGGTASIVTSVPGAPVTAQRPVPKDLDGKLESPGMRVVFLCARALLFACKASTPAPFIPQPLNIQPKPKHPNKGVPRANQAVSREKPDGSAPALARGDYTVMQQHVAFFDTDSDGVIWPWDTYNGCARASVVVVVLGGRGR
jgi:hypothetical protein